MEILYSIIASIFTVVIAARLTHNFAIKRIKDNELLKYQLLSYTDFISAAARLSVARRLGSSKNDIDELAKLNDAKNRILICGNKEVVSALLVFWKEGATLEKEGALLSFQRLCSEMRLSMGHKNNDLINLEISNAMFKLEPSSYSFRAHNKKEDLK